MAYLRWTRTVVFYWHHISILDFDDGEEMTATKDNRVSTNDTMCGRDAAQLVLFQYLEIEEQKTS